MKNPARLRNFRMLNLSIESDKVEAVLGIARRNCWLQRLWDLIRGRRWRGGNRWEIR